MKNFIMKSVGAIAALGASATVAAAAGAGTGIESGFTDVGTDLNTLLTGAGGFIIIVVSIMFAAFSIATGRGWGPAIGAFAVALFLGYGVTALQGIGGVTATTDMLLTAEASVEAQPLDSHIF